MKKYLWILAALLMLPGMAFADGTSTGGASSGGIVSDASCNQSKYYTIPGPICRDSVTGKFWMPTGTGIWEIPANTGAVTFRGAYDPSTNYDVADSVSYNGSSYAMHTDGPAGTLPTDTDYWQVLAAKGATGAAGANGSNGTDGTTYYTYVGFASDASGNDFATDPSSNLNYIAIKISTTELTPVASDFAGLWKDYKGATGAAGANGSDGSDGSDGSNGASAFVYIAYADDAAGTGYTQTYDASKNYVAVLSTDTVIASPQASDFAGLWFMWKGQQGETGDAGAAGAAGSTTYTGTDAPLDASGNDSDLYIRTGTSPGWYRKASGTWVLLFAPTADNSTAGHIICKDALGNIVNCSDASVQSAALTFGSDVQDDIAVRGASGYGRLNITEQTLIGRVTGGHVAPLAPAAIKTLLGYPTSGDYVAASGTLPYAVKDVSENRTLPAANSVKTYNATTGLWDGSSNYSTPQATASYTMSLAELRPGNYFVLDISPNSAAEASGNLPVLPTIANGCMGLSALITMGKDDASHLWGVSTGDTSANIALADVSGNLDLATTSMKKNVYFALQSSSQSILMTTKAYSTTGCVWVAREYTNKNGAARMAIR